MRFGASIVAVALAVACATALATARAGSGERFTSHELSLLTRGELVSRPVEQRRGELRLMGGTSWQVIDAPPEVLWQALLDTDHYDRMLPQLIEARVLEEDDGARRLMLRHGASFVQTSYHLVMRADHARRDLSFRLDESRENGIRAAWGFYTVKPYEGGRSLLVYAVMADIGDGLATAVVRPTVHEWMLKVPTMIKRFVEGSGRLLYAPKLRDGRPGMASAGH